MCDFLFIFLSAKPITDSFKTTLTKKHRALYLPQSVNLCGLYHVVQYLLSHPHANRTNSKTNSPHYILNRELIEQEHQILSKTGTSD